MIVFGRSLLDWRYETGQNRTPTLHDLPGLQRTFYRFCLAGSCFFRATGKNQSFEVGSGQNQSEPDAEKQTCDRLVRPDFMYQTLGIMSLVLIFGLCGGIATSAPVAGPWPLWPRGRTWTGKPATGQTWGSRGAGRRDTPSKCRTVRNDEGVSVTVLIRLAGSSLL